jgi:bacterioferritin
MTDTFAIDVTRIRDEARQHLKQGPVTPSNTTDIDREQVAEMFTDHAAEELGHFQRVSDRVNQLGGSPDMNPATMKERSSTDYSTPSSDSDLQGMIRENLIAERIVIGAYAEIIRCLGTADPTSRRLVEDILKEEEDHADELNDLFTG